MKMFIVECRLIDIDTMIGDDQQYNPNCLHTTLLPSPLRKKALQSFIEVPKEYFY